MNSVNRLNLIPSVSLKYKRNMRTLLDISYSQHVSAAVAMTKWISCLKLFRLWCFTLIELNITYFVWVLTTDDWLRSGRSGIESRRGRDFPLFQTGPGAHPASCKIGTGSSSGVNCGRGVLLTAHPLLVPRSWKSRAVTLPTLWATPGLWRDHFTLLTHNWTVS